MTKSDIVSYSKKLLDNKTSISSSVMSFVDYNEQIIDSLETDTLNRNVFLSSASILSALTLEFRNIYGIEAPYYKIKDCRVNVKNFGAVADDIENEWFKDCPEIINAAEYACEDTKGYIEYDGKESVVPCTKQNFFIDNNRVEYESKFKEAMCPPGFDRWAGTFLYDSICKEYMFTEQFLSDLYNDPKEITCDFSTNKPFSYNISEDGVVTKNNYFYTIDDGILNNYLVNKKYAYKITDANVRTDDPIVDFIFEREVISTPIFGPTPEPTEEDPEPEPPIIGYTYEYGEYPFMKSWKPIAKYTCGSSSGYAVLIATPVEFPEDGDVELTHIDIHYYINLLTQENKSVKKEYDKFGWLTEKNSLSGSKSEIKAPADFTIPIVDDMKNAVATYYKNSLKYVLGYYNYFISTGKSCKIEYKDSIQTMQNIVDADDENISEAISNRISYINETDRARTIDTFMKNNQAMFDAAFLTIQDRLNKKGGTLTDALSLVENTNYASEILNSKKKNMSDLFKEMVLFDIVDGFGSNAITVELAPWEPDSVIYGNFGRMTNAYIVCDDETLINNVRVLDIVKIKNASGRNGSQFIVSLSEKADELIKGQNPRLVKLINYNDI